MIERIKEIVFSEIHVCNSAILRKLESLVLKLNSFNFSSFDEIHLVKESNNSVNRKRASIRIGDCKIEISKIFLEIFNKILKKYQPQDFEVQWYKWNSNEIYVRDFLKERNSTVYLPYNFAINEGSRSIKINSNWLLLCGGTSNWHSTQHANLAKVFLIELDSGQVIKIKSMNCGRTHLCLVFHQGFAYALGGYNLIKHYLKSCERLDLKTLLWTKIANLNELRSNSTALSYKNCIYLFGGAMDFDYLNKIVEKYDNLSNQWFSLDIVLPFYSFNLGAILLEISKSILLFGGYDCEEGKWINNSCIVNLEDLSIQECGNMITQSSEIWLKPTLINGIVYSYAFNSENELDIIKFQLETFTWIP